MSSFRFIPVLKLLQQTRAASQSCQPEADIWGTSSQTHVGKRGRSCWAQPLPAQARVMPPSPGLEDKASGWKQLPVPPGPSTACCARGRQGSDGHIVSRGLAARGCAGNSREAGLLFAQPSQLTPYVPYFPVCFVTTEISDSLLLQNRKQHVMV